MSMESVVIVRVGGEIGIKSRPVRRDYEQRLLRHIKGRLREKGVPFSEIWRIAGRIYIRTGDAETASRLASRVFGVSSASPGRIVSSSLDEIVEAAVSIAKGFSPGSFAVRCRRVGSHPYTSQEAAARVGEAILGMRSDLRVDLGCPSSELSVEIRDGSAILYTDAIRGPDGFPLGTQDPLVGVVDDTFDSLAASWCLMKRGSRLVAAVAVPEGILTSGIARNLAALSEWSAGAPFRAVVFPCEAQTPPILRLLLASSYCRANGFAATVSGMPVPSLELLSWLYSKISPPVLLPLIALDRGMISYLAGLMGIGLGSAVRYQPSIDFGEPPPSSVVEAKFQKAFEVSVREDGSILPL
ncbi:MAG: hypothetical protein H5T33_01680 [Candidatus Methanosuratus sp.]|nr:hypothetical protein [Candidatus Methanosuratincola sp.]